MSHRYYFKTWGPATEDHLLLFSITKVQSHFNNKAINKLSADKTKKLSIICSNWVGKILCSKSSKC